MVLKVYTGVHAQVNYDPVISSNIVILYTEYIALGMILNSVVKIKSVSKFVKYLRKTTLNFKLGFEEEQLNIHNVWYDLHWFSSYYLYLCTSGMNRWSIYDSLAS